MSTTLPIGAGSKPFQRITRRYFDDHKENTVDYSRRFGLDDVLYRLAAYEDEGLSPEDVHKRLEWLKEYVKAEMEGSLLKMPCPLGGTVYVIGTKSLPRTALHHSSGKGQYKYIRKTVLTKRNTFELSAEFGKTVFLTRQEAEASLVGWK